MKTTIEILDDYEYLSKKIICNKAKGVFQNMCYTLSICQGFELLFDKDIKHISCEDIMEKVQEAYSYNIIEQL